MHGFLTGGKAERGGGRWKGDYREEITEDLKDNLRGERTMFTILCTS